MSKLFNLKKWLTVEEAEKHLSVMFDEIVSRADILRLVLDGRLTISANFINQAYAIQGEVVDIHNADFVMSTDLNPISNKPFGFHGPGPIFCQPYKIARGDEIRDGEFFKRGEFIIIDGVWDLVMSGDNNHNLEHEYQYLTNGPEVTLISLDGIYLEKPDGTTCNLQVSFDENEYTAGSQAHLDSVDLLINSGDLSTSKVKKLRAETDAARSKYLSDKNNRKKEEDYHPASQLPDDAVLVIRTGAIQELITQLEHPESSHAITPLKLEPLEVEVSKLGLNYRNIMELKSWNDFACKVSLAVNKFPEWRQKQKGRVFIV